MRENRGDKMWLAAKEVKPPSPSLAAANTCYGGGSVARGQYCADDVSHGVEERTDWGRDGGKIVAACQHTHGNICWKSSKEGMDIIAQIQTTFK